MGQQKRLPTGQMVAEPVPPTGSTFDQGAQQGLGALSAALKQRMLPPAPPPVLEEELPIEEEFPSLPIERIQPDLGPSLLALQQALARRK